MHITNALHMRCVAGKKGGGEAQEGGEKAAERAAAQAKKEAEKEAEKAAKAADKELAILRKAKEQARCSCSRCHGPRHPIAAPLMRHPPPFGAAGGSNGCQDV